MEFGERFCLVIVDEKCASRLCSYRSQRRQLLGGKQSVLKISLTRGALTTVWNIPGGRSHAECLSVANYFMTDTLTFYDFERSWRPRKPFSLRVPVGLMFTCRELSPETKIRKGHSELQQTHQPVMAPVALCGIKSPASLLFAQKKRLFFYREGRAGLADTFEGKPGKWVRVDRQQGGWFNGKCFSLSSAHPWHELVRKTFCILVLAQSWESKFTAMGGEKPD